VQTGKPQEQPTAGIVNKQAFRLYLPVGMCRMKNLVYWLMPAADPTTECDITVLQLLGGKLEKGARNVLRRFSPSGEERSAR
jgi:hypothetical protein